MKPIRKSAKTTMLWRAVLFDLVVMMCFGVQMLWTEVGREDGWIRWKGA